VLSLTECSELALLLSWVRLARGVGVAAALAVTVAVAVTLAGAVAVAAWLP
jgi:hypothetical protein